MFERFTDRAREVVVLAQDEADGLGHDFIGTEHLLLGLAAEEHGVARRVLDSLGVTSRDLRSETEKLVGLSRRGSERVDSKALASIGIDLDEVRRRAEASFGPGALERTRAGKRGLCGARPFTKRAKKALELSLREARFLDHDYIGTEHILLGLLREGEGVAAQLLRDHGLELDRVRAAVVDELSR